MDYHQGSFSDDTNVLIINDASARSGGSVESLFQPLLSAEDKRKVHSLQTITAATLEVIIACGLQIGVVMLIFMHPAHVKKCERYFVLCYAHVVFWAVSLIIDQYFKVKHHNLRLAGYLEFYRQIHIHFRVPFYITSSWNALLLVTTTVFYHKYESLFKECSSEKLFTPSVYLSMLITLENIILIPVLIAYIVKVWKFNQRKSPPDIKKEEWMARYVQSDYADEIGSKNDHHIFEVLEKQADLIENLFEHNRKLGEKVLLLSAQKRRQDAFSCN